MRSNRIISDAAVEEALQELALLDDKEAELKAARDYGEAKLKEIYSECFLDCSGTVAERESYARTSPDYIEHLKNLRTVVERHGAARNKRDRLMMVIEVWRSENANMRGRT